jgi:hypothetical protein
MAKRRKRRNVDDRSNNAESIRGASGDDHLVKKRRVDETLLDSTTDALSVGEHQSLVSVNLSKSKKRRKRQRRELDVHQTSETPSAACSITKPNVAGKTMEK